MLFAWQDIRLMPGPFRAAQETDRVCLLRLDPNRSHTGGAGEPFTHGRDANGWFGYQVKVLPDQPVFLRCAYWGSDAGRTFDILVNGTKIATETLKGRQPGDYLYVTYAIPDTLTHGKDHVTVRFEGKNGSLAGGLFDLRVVRKELSPLA